MFTYSSVICLRAGTVLTGAMRNAQFPQSSLSFTLRSDSPCLFKRHESQQAHEQMKVGGMKGGGRKLDDL